MTMNYKKTASKWILSCVFAMLFGGMLVNVALPSRSYAACNERLLTLPTWYKGLTDDKCDIKSPADVKGGIQGFITRIALNVLEMALQAIGYLSVGFIIRGGFKYLTSVGDPKEMATARKIIMDACIGLIISILSVGIVTFVANAINAGAK